VIVPQKGKFTFNGDSRRYTLGMDASDIAKRLAERLSELMTAKGWIQADLARESGMGTGNVTRLLSGRHNPTAPMLAKLSNVFGVDVCELLCPVKPKRKS
jgi:transcriptional regulator with XRE-family HTH domain